MKIPLWMKLSGGFLTIIMIFGLVLTLFIRQSAGRQLSQFVQTSDIEFSREIAGMLTEELQYIEPGGVSEHMLFDELLMEGLSSSRMMGPRSHREGGLFMFHSMMHRGRSEFQEIVLTDSEGNVRRVYGPPEELEQLPRILPPSGGTPVYSSDDVVGYVYAGTMIDPALDQYHRQLLTSLDRSVSLAALIALAAAAGMSLVLSFHIISPVTSLRRAAGSIARGDYHVRVKIARKDELGDLARDFNEMAEALHRGEQWKQQVISDSAHELRTPVALLAAEIEMMLEGVYAPDREQLTHMQREVGQLTRLIDELQTLSEVESGRVQLKEQQVHLRDFLEQIAASFSHTADKTDVTYTCQRVIPEGAVEIPREALVSFDPGRIEQVVVNLLKNGMSFTPPEGSIDLSCYSGVDGKVVVAVEDSGPGIPLQERSRVFDRFYRVETHRDRRQGGAGLGLAISREIMRLHGGVLSAVDPIRLGGARFEMKLPQGVVHSAT